MDGGADKRESGRALLRGAGYGRSLSARLLVLTVLFIMIAEVLIFVPSIANFRATWLEQRLARAQIATLALEATPDNMVSRDLERELLRNAEALAVVLHRNSARRLVLSGDKMPEVEATFDLRGSSAPMLIWEAFDALAAGDGRIIRVIGEPLYMGGDIIDIVIEETPLRAAMLRYGLNIFLLSLVISIFTAALVFLTLNRMFVRPLKRLTGNMVAFREKPEDIGRVISASARQDEIGIAERELEAMQRQIRSTLNQQAHLAGLGRAVSKINHDLRNILASAQLISDRLSSVSDPTVQRLAPRLFASIDRAIDLCAKTLKFGRAEEDPPQRRFFSLADLVEEARSAAGLGAPGSGDEGRIRFFSEVPEGMRLYADPDQVFRILLNLVRNAAQALDGGDGDIRVKAWAAADGTAEIEVSDTGPGLAPRARAHLFEAFSGAARAGGTGLGLAISAELAGAHGGRVELVESRPGQTVFRVSLPQDQMGEAEAAQ